MWHGTQQFVRGQGIRRKFPIEPQRHRLRYRYAFRQRELLDSRCLQLHAAAGRTIRLRQHQDNFNAGVVNHCQRGGGKVGRACKDNLHEVV